MLVVLSGTLAVVIFESPLKAEEPMVFTLSPMYNLITPLQPSKAEEPMLVTLSEIDISEKLEQL